MLSLLGGVYFPLGTHGFLYGLAQYIPSYWLVQAGKSASGGGDWPAEGWIVVAIWIVALVPLAVLAYRRDTSRV